MPSLYLTSALGLLSLLPAAQAGWNPNSKDNVVVYWGKFTETVKDVKEEAETNKLSQF
jgi:chitinase